MIKSFAKRSKKPREPMFISPLHVHFYISRLESDKMILNLFFEKKSLDQKFSKRSAKLYRSAKQCEKKKSQNSRNLGNLSLK